MNHPYTNVNDQISLAPNIYETENEHGKCYTVYTVNIHMPMTAIHKNVSSKLNLINHYTQMSVVLTLVLIETESCVQTSNVATATNADSIF